MRRHSQKAVRSLEVGGHTLLWEDREWQDGSGPPLDNLPLYPTDIRLWALMAALRRNVAPDDVSRNTGIDPWFPVQAV